MILKIHSDSSYLNEPKICSCGGVHFYLSNKADNKPNVNNGALLTISQLLRNVILSSAEAECGALFNNAKQGVPLRISLKEMGHPQPPTPIQVDNSTAAGFANRQIKQNRTKSMEWIQDRVTQKQFKEYLRPGHTNLADYFTNHHAPSHHR